MDPYWVVTVEGDVLIITVREGGLQHRMKGMTDMREWFLSLPPVPRVVIDVTTARWLDECDKGRLVWLWKWAKDRGGSVSMYGCNATVLASVELCHLHSLIAVRQTKQEALDALLVPQA